MSMCLSLPSTDSLLHSKPTMQELLDHVVRHVAARWYEFGIYLKMDCYLLDNTKADEGAKVRACCIDMFKHWLNKEQGTGGEERSWSTVLGAVQRCLGREAAENIAAALQAAQ